MSCKKQTRHKLVAVCHLLFYLSQDKVQYSAAPSLSPLNCLFHYPLKKHKELLLHLWCTALFKQGPPLAKECKCQHEIGTVTERGVVFTQGKATSFNHFNNSELQRGNREIIPNHSVERTLKQINKKITTPTKQKPTLLLMECGNDEETCNSMEMRTLHLIPLE